MAVAVLCLVSGVLAQTGGVSSLSGLSHLAGCHLSEEQRQELMASHPGEQSSMLDIKRAAEKLGLALEGVAATFDELTSDLPGPKIIHLADPAHFLVLARASDEWVQLLDGGRVVVVPRAEIEKRYSGHALIQPVHLGVQMRRTRLRTPTCVPSPGDMRRLSPSTTTARLRRSTVVRRDEAASFGRSAAWLTPSGG